MLTKFSMMMDERIFDLRLPMKFMFLVGGYHRQLFANVDG